MNKKVVEHKKAVERWRKLEENAKAVGEVIVIMPDGTGSTGLPRLRCGVGGVRNMTLVHSEVVLEPLFGPVGHTHTGLDAAHTAD
jgi:hypothetical protein